jgi:UDP-2,3-diacylglucosamine hydrolase
MGRALFISDLHLSPREPAALEAFHGFLRRENGSFDTLYIMGDLFEYWIGPRHLRLPDYRRELEAIRSLVRGGVRVLLFQGNRDFLFHGRVARDLGVEIVSDYMVETFGPHRTYLCHGDLLCSNDRNHQIMRRVLQGQLFALVYGALPVWAALGIADWGRGLSRRLIAGKTMRTLDLSEHTVRRIFRGLGNVGRPGRFTVTGEVDTLVCGHIHRPGERNYNVGGRQCRVIVLGAWEPGPSYLEFVDGQFRLHAGNGHAG